LIQARPAHAGNVHAGLLQLSLPDFGIGLCFSQFVGSFPNGHTDPFLSGLDSARPHSVDQSLEEEIVRLLDFVQLPVVPGVLGTCVQITIGCLDLFSRRPSRLHDH